MGNNFSGSRNESLNTCRSQSITISKNIINGIINQLQRAKEERESLDRLYGLHPYHYPLHIKLRGMTADGSSVDLWLYKSSWYCGLISMLVALSRTSRENECILNFNFDRCELMSINCTYISESRLLGLDSPQEQTLELYRQSGEDTIHNYEWGRDIIVSKECKFTLCRKSNSEMKEVDLGGGYTYLNDKFTTKVVLSKKVLKGENHSTIHLDPHYSYVESVLQELGLVPIIEPPAVAPSVDLHSRMNAPTGPDAIAPLVHVAPPQEEPSLVFQPLSGNYLVLPKSWRGTIMR